MLFHPTLQGVFSLNESNDLATYIGMRFFSIPLVLRNVRSQKGNTIFPYREI
jgi:hypothetical protein